MPANPVKGEVPLVLSDGREFVLVLDMEAMLSVEQSYGKPLPKVMADAGEGYLSAIAAIAQAAFVRHHPTLTRAEVLDLLRTAREPLSEALQKASEVAFPDEKPGNGSAGGNAPKDRGGKSSGRSGAKRG